MANQQKPGGYFLGPLSKKAALRQARTSARLQFGPQVRELQGERRASKMRMQQIPDWFAQYQQQLRGLSQNTQQGYQQALQGFQGELGQSASYEDALRAKLAQQDATDASLRGAATPTAGLSTSINASIARRNLADTYGGLLRSQNATQGAYYADKRRLASATQVDQLLREAARGRSTNADMQALRAQQGQAAQTELERLRESDRQFKLQQQTLKGENKRAKLAARTSRKNTRVTSKTSRIDSKRTRKTALDAQKISWANLAERVRHDKAIEHGSGSGGTSTHAYKQQVHQITHVMTDLFNRYGLPPFTFKNSSGKKQTIQWADIPSYLLHQEGISSQPLVDKIVKDYRRRIRRRTQQGTSGAGNPAGP